MENMEKIDKLIIGRVEPHIYAFSTNTIPNYLKIGDTYRPVLVRLREWKNYFPNLKQEFVSKATINSDVFFRDYSVHDYLENELRKHRLTQEDMSQFPKGTYYSKEFFENTNPLDVQSAINDIQNSFQNNEGKYQFYNSKTSLPETYTYASTGLWKPRDNQQKVIDNFMAAINNGRTNLLMYAVMRFGKTFTSLCCAKEMNAKIVLVVSAKADVRDEWKKTVQSAENFNTDYVFLSSDDLIRDNDVIEKIRREENGVVVFLTLQDLQGDSIKEKHKELFEHEIDLLIIDETHYGARAESYGEIIRNAKDYTKDIKLKLETEDADDYVETKDAETQLKSLKVRVKLHLSGTPYRILMGSEFSKEDIICFCQFTDIIREQENWDRENLHIDNKSEWDNPYYGFPQMVRFAFSPSKSAIELLNKLKHNGTSFAFSELFKPMSISRQNDNSHKKFIHEKEVLSLFEAIDSPKDESVFAFLDYKKIQEGNMCRHIVCVLPYCASCDALEELLKNNIELFKNLKDYEIINISGVDSGKTYKTVQSIKNRIKKCEENNKKTATLTVNRMLTGSTVEQWDTMIFLKDTASPQEYDQAIFRLQNQYIKTYIDSESNVIKYNMKPQTLLVDFDPHRVFMMQEQKSKIYNVNTDANGNHELRDRIEEELEISPIITVNKGKIKQVEAADILEIVAQYSSSRGVKEEAQDIPVDISLLNIKKIKIEIEKQAEIGSKDGFIIEAHEGEGTDYDDPKGENGEEHVANKETKGTTDKDLEDNSEIKILQNKFKTYYSRILFFAFLTENIVEDLEGVINSVNNEDNKRIINNLELDVEILKLIQENINPFILSSLDYKIQNINKLSHDNSIPAIERANTAMAKFGKLSESEITTPISIASDMINSLPDSCFTTLIEPQNKILDIASKMGEFAIAICKRCEELHLDLVDIKDSIESVPTSSVAYEFTRKVYKILGLDVDMISKEFYSYDLAHKMNDNSDTSKLCNLLMQNIEFCKINLNNQIIESRGNHKVKFNAIVGNPPYQESDGGAGASSKPIYPNFVEISKRLSSNNVSLIIPSRWYTGGKGGKDMDAFRQSMLDDTHIKTLHDFLNPEEIFPDTNNRGGVCYFHWDNEYNNSSLGVDVYTHEEGKKTIHAKRALKTKNLDIFIRNNSAIEILNKVMDISGENMMYDHISSRKPFGIESNIVKKEYWHNSKEQMVAPIKCLGKGSKYGYIEQEFITKNDYLIDSWKVFTPRANNIGTELSDDNLNTIIGEPGTVCTEAYIVLGIDLGLTNATAHNLAKYFNTKFVRFMHSLAKSSHDAPKKTYRFVPCQDFNQEWTDEKLYKKYNLTQEEIDMIESSIK